MGRPAKKWVFWGIGKWLGQGSDRAKTSVMKLSLFAVTPGVTGILEVFRFFSLFFRGLAYLGAFGAGGAVILSLP